MAGCQLRCGNCYRPPQAGMGKMPEKFVKTTVKEAGRAGFSEIVLIGGEPTLHPQLPEFMQLVLDTGLTPILCTNGLRLSNKTYCERVILPGTTVVIHGLVPVPPDTMDRHVGLKGYTERLKDTYANLEELRQEGRNITIVAEAVVIRPFLRHLLDFHKWCRANNYVPFIEMNRRGNNGQPNALSVSPEEVHNLFLQLQSWDQENAPSLIDTTLTPPAYGNKCTMSITGLHVKNFGSNSDYAGVYSCCAQTVRHGDLLRESVTEILASDQMSVFKNQDDWIVGPCRNCAYYPVCRGGCRGEASLIFGCPRASCPACWHIPPEIRNDRRAMAPLSCRNCPLEENPGCSLPKKR
ncbi:MAG: radical SAM protein [bacterium]|nr:radical SAM protein [bacterium]